VSGGGRGWASGGIGKPLDLPHCILGMVRLVLRKRVDLSEFSLNSCDTWSMKSGFAALALVRHSSPAFLTAYYCNGDEEADLSQSFCENPRKIGTRNSNLSHRHPRKA